MWDKTILLSVGLFEGLSQWETFILYTKQSPKFLQSSHINVEIFGTWYPKQTFPAYGNGIILFVLATVVTLGHDPVTIRGYNQM